MRQRTGRWRKPPISAPALVPAMQAIGMRRRSSSASTPKWRKPRAPPLPNTTPTRGGCVGGGSAAPGASRPKAISALSSRRRITTQSTVMGDLVAFSSQFTRQPWPGSAPGTTQRNGQGRAPSGARRRPRCDGKGQLGQTDGRHQRAVFQQHDASLPSGGSMRRKACGTMTNFMVWP